MKGEFYIGCLNEICRSLHNFMDSKVFRFATHAYNIMGYLRVLIVLLTAILFHIRSQGHLPASSNYFQTYGYLYRYKK